MIDIKSPRWHLKKQWRNVMIALSILAVLIIVILSNWTNQAPAQNAPEATTEQNVNVALNTSHLSQSELYLAKTENAFKAQKDATEILKSQVDQISNLQQSHEEMEKVNQVRYDQLQQRIFELENALKATAAINNQSVAGVAEDGTSLPVLPTPNSGKEGNLPPPTPTITSHGIQNDELHLSFNKSTKANNNAERNPETYVPAGTFATAVLLSGLDASAGVTSQTQPRPVLLRIINEGTLPDNKQSHLTNCLITAAGYGDISSERAYIRLERMSCTKEKEAITDFPVYGYVSGPDGKAGIRGNPVWREGVLLKRGFISGLFAGLGQGVANGFTTTSLSPLGATQSVNGSDIAKQGLAKGAGTALGKLADYNIQRAEQYQPVIQVSAGSTVEVVFHTGFYLDGRENQTTQNDDNNEPTSSEGQA